VVEKEPSRQPCAPQAALRGARRDTGGMGPIAIRTVERTADGSAVFPSKMRRKAAPAASHSLAMVQAFDLVSGPKL